MIERDRIEPSAAIERLEARVAALESGAAVSGPTGAEAPARPHASTTRTTSRRWRWTARGVLLAMVLALPTMVAANDVFTDVPTSSSFHNVINIVKNAGFTSGCTPTTYCPNDPVSRAQMAAFLVRSAGRMDYQTITDLTPVADQPFASVTIKTEGRAQIWANATFYMNILRGGSDFYPCQGRTYIAIDDVIDQSSYAYGVGHEIPPVSGAITEQIGQQSVKIVNAGNHVVELFYDGVIVGSCGITVGKGYLTAMVVPFDGLGKTP
jgi:hypothetical protein